MLFVWKAIVDKLQLSDESARDPYVSIIASALKLYPASKHTLSGTSILLICFAIFENLALRTSSTREYMTPIAPMFRNLIHFKDDCLWFPCQNSQRYRFSNSRFPLRGFFK